MKYNTKQWLNNLMHSREYMPMPLLSSPVVQLMNVSVKDFISDPDLQAKGMKMVVDKVDSAAALSPMDLSVEAENFGCQVAFEDDEVPNVVSSVVHGRDDADNLIVPEAGTGRTGVCLDAIRKVSDIIDDRPVLAGMIGPFSLAGRLMDVSEIMIYCFDDPEMVHQVMNKVTCYLIECCKKYRDAGADGIIMAEPLAGILSPSLADEFSHPYVKKIVEEVQSDEFAVIYHNCGNNVEKMADSIFGIGAMAYHFGNSINLRSMLEKSPSDVPVMGNIDPALILNGSPEEVAEATRSLINSCGEYPNFCVSSGCDIPPKASWENIVAFFAAAKEFKKN